MNVTHKQHSNLQSTHTTCGVVSVVCVSLPVLPGVSSPSVIWTLTVSVLQASMFSCLRIDWQINRDFLI